MLIWTRAPRTDSRSFLLLDRDGVINCDSPEYIKHWREFHFYPDSLATLRGLHERNIEVILISNQSALNRGIMSWEHFWDLHERMLQAIREAGGALLATLYCPHRPDEQCGCRKPAPAMIRTAAQLFDIKLSETAFIGDKRTDLLAAANAGCRGILLDRSGTEPSPAENSDTTHYPTCHTSFAAAVNALFATEQSHAPNLQNQDAG